MKIRDIVFVITIGLLVSGCGEGYRYHHLMEKELATGIRHDSLFMGIYLGMSQKEFYAHCWQLNKKGIFRNGSGNSSVYYKTAELKDTVEINFYPNFYKGKIWRVPVKYNYQSWAPWNKRLYADSLEQKLAEYFARQYGNDFHKVLNADKEISYYRIDGNRLISIFKGNGDQYVWVIYTDLPVYNEIQKLKKNKKDSTTADVNPFMF